MERPQATEHNGRISKRRYPKLEFRPEDSQRPLEEAVESSGSEF